MYVLNLFLYEFLFKVIIKKKILKHTLFLLHEKSFKFSSFGNSDFSLIKLLSHISSSKYGNWTKSLKSL